MLFRRQIRRFHRFLGRCLNDPVPPQPFGMETFCRMLKQRGFRPAHIFDVGANKGEWTRFMASFFPSAKYTLMEPQADLREHVDDLIENGREIRWLNAGAADQAGDLLFTLGQQDDSSSFAISWESAQEQGLKQITVPVRTVDEVLATENLPPPDLLKVDAEGYDLKVLDGARSILDQTDIILIEVAVGAEGLENSLPAVAERMEQANYRFFDITDIMRSRQHGVLWLCEFAFLRHGSPLLTGANSYY